MGHYPNDYRHNSLQELFPYQFRSVRSTIVWSLIFLLDVVLVFVAVHLMGFNIFTAGLRHELRLLLVGGYLLVAFGLFVVETGIHNKLRKKQEKTFPH